jgi:hypothetical protein
MGKKRDDELVGVIRGLGKQEKKVKGVRNVNIEEGFRM